MSRFLKNATFPILIVVVLAFFAQRFLGQNESKPMLVEQIQAGHRQTVWPMEEADGPALYPAPTWAVRTGTPDPTPPPAKLPATGGPPGRT